MSLGMGMVFVPLTLTAVHGVDAKDSGIGSGVLNAMQQIGGALGLAILSTVAVGTMNDKAAAIECGRRQARPRTPASRPTRPGSSARSCSPQARSRPSWSARS